MSKYIFDLIKKEEKRQANTIELIASENFVSKDIMRALGSCLTNKYTEGYPGKRYYGGCENYDELENYCKQMWQKVFHTDYHVNVQPHSGSSANFAAYMAFLKPGDTVLAMSLSNGGHLTHGSRVNFSGKFYNFIEYGLDKDGKIDYDDFKQKIIDWQPKLIVAGASAYPREIDFEYMYDIIQDIIKDHERRHSLYHPIFMADISHIAGLVAADYHCTPFGYCDVITTTTHKTLRGPRGALIFCKPDFAKQVDSAVFPGSQGGSLQHVIAAKAIAAEEACEPSFQKYIKRVIENANAMAKEFVKWGFDVITDGTDTHMLLLDLSKTHPHVTGKMLQDELDKEGITLNKNSVPGEKRSPVHTSGVRIGTPAMTTKGYREHNFIWVAHRIMETADALEVATTGGEV